MENEAIDCLNGEEQLNLLPDPENQPLDLLSSENEEAEDSGDEKLKRKKLKRRQYFRRVHLKKERESMKTVHHAPSVIPNLADEPMPFSRDQHDFYVMRHNNRILNEVDITEGKTEDELQAMAETQKGQLQELKTENQNLRAAIFRMKKQLDRLARM